MKSLSKTCSYCGETKPHSEFYKDKKLKDGLHIYCKGCVTLKNKQWNCKNTYLCTTEEYDKAMATSDCCKVCGRKENLCYDHDHTTGKFRGVLCKVCNKAIGALGDTPEGVLKAYNYLKEYYDGTD